MRTKQQIFDIVVEHLRKQRETSLSENGSCAYRGTNGLKCAVGCLIPDKKYDKNIEGADVCCPIVYQRLPQDCRTHLGMLRDLQVVHDNRNVEGWEEEFVEIAAKHDLKYKEPQCEQHSKSLTS